MLPCRPRCFCSFMWRMVKSFVFPFQHSFTFFGLQVLMKFEFYSAVRRLITDWKQLEVSLSQTPFSQCEKCEFVCMLCYDWTSTNKPVPHSVLFLGELNPTAELQLARKQFSCVRKCDLCQAQVASLLALLFRCAVQINRYIKGSMHIPFSPCRLPYKSPECPLHFLLISPPV